MTRSEIAWCQDTVNVIGGCSDASPGCQNCYSRGISHRFGGTQALYQGTTVNDGQGVQWSGRVNTNIEPLIRYRKKSGRRIFLNSMSDWCLPAVSTGFIGQMWEEICRQPQHTWLLLTKRPGRIPKVLGPDGIGWYTTEGPVPRPQPGIHLGTSIESDDYCWRADRLREAPAAVRFLSLEPLLGPLPSLDLTGIGQVIIGCESGQGRRPMELAWAREIVAKARDAGAAVFVKQLQLGPSRKVETDPFLFPTDLRFQEYPNEEAT